MSVRIDGEAASFEDAIERAAAVLSAGRAPVVAGLGTDIAGVRAALKLAEHLRAAVGHSAGPALARDIAVLSETGLLFATPTEAGRRADTVLLVGDLAARAGWLAEVFGRDGAPTRTVVSLAASAKAAAALDAGGTLLALDIKGLGVRDTLLALKARVGGRPVDAARLGRTGLRDLDKAVKTLAAAQYGVVVWDAADLDGLAVEAAAGLVRDLNAATRFAAVPFPGDDNAAGTVLACAWTTGFPPPLGFPGGIATHDPWRFDVDRMVASGEADAALWISAMTPGAPTWTQSPPTVALVAAGTRFATPPAVVIEVRRPDRTADAVLHDARTNTLTPVAAPRGKAAADGAPTVAAVIEAIHLRLSGKGGAPC
ncbi:tungsten formylmethanofuran dehydrogenase [Pseudoxanthobacter sp. M-2]|uniref:tungsten formylmethanofuran dehydrogenase n=1 Tax=Pseudoxanthobacter sp. M-2 TaxID=3078754 RepID=UPI0038FC36F4